MTDIEQLDNPQNTQETPQLDDERNQVAGVYWSLNEASRQTGVPKGTLSKDAAAGKIQWHDQPGGGRKFHAAEIHHFYSNRIKLSRQAKETENSGNTNRNSVSVPDPEQRNAPNPTSEQLEKLQETAIELAVLKERLQARDEMIRTQAGEIEHLRDQNQRITLMLAAPPAAATPPSQAAPELAAKPPEPETKKRGFFGIFSR